MNKLPNNIQQRGFTLIELIMVVVLLGALGVMGSEFISRGFRGFQDTDNRVAIYEEGKLAMVRMEQEIHDAVPNAFDSATLAGDATDLRFGMLAEDVARAANSFGRYQETPPTTSLTDPTGALPLNTVISIYNRNWSDFTNTVAVQRRLYTVTGVAGTTMTISKTLVPARSSPQKRYYPVDRAVRYYLSGTSLLRAQLPVTVENVNFATLPTQPGYPLARGIVPGSLQFSYAPASLSRNAVVTVSFSLARDGEQVSFHKEIHARNVP
jgi:MSHA biogenesis protein MshO